MRRTPYLLLVVTVSMMLSATICSCSREDDPEKQKEEQEDKKVEDWENEDINGDATMAPGVMQFSVGNMTSITRGATSFDGTSHSFSPGDRITIEMYRGSVKVGTKKYKVVYDETEAKLKLEFDDTGLPFAWENTLETVKLRAWSYGTAEAYTTDPLDDDNPFSLNKNQTETTAGRDNYRELLYSPQQDYTYTSGEIELKLYHQMSRLTVELTHSKTTEDLAVTANSVVIGDGLLPITAKFSESGIDISNDDYIGSWKNDGFTYDTENNTGKIVARTDAANEKYSAVLFPGEIASGRRLITLTTADGTFAYKLPSAITLLPGKQYNYTINVKDLVPVTELTISDITGTFTYNGSAHTPEPASVTYGDKVLEKDTDYELEWLNNTNAGTATCRVKGKGSVFTGYMDKTFTINKAPATISFANATVTKTYLDANFTEAVTNTGDGTVTYASANTTDATVGSSNGTVSILNANTTGFNITATVVDGDNYTYSTKTASYKLVINRKPTTLTFASSTKSVDYVWNLSSATNALTKNPATATVSFTSSNTNLVNVNNSTGALSAGSNGGTATSGTVTITATATGNYSGSATYTVTTSNNASFAYKNSEYSITLPKGKYNFECWGADGGNGYATYILTGYSYGGKGGYTYGQLTLIANGTFFINVGGAGTNTSTAHYEGNGVHGLGGKTVAGGYNGGGNGIEWNNENDYVHNGGGGGGATHVATASGLLSTRTKTQVLMVAGGGGGGGGHTGGLTGGHAGGTTGLAPGADPTSAKTSFEIAQGGSQTEGGGWLRASDNITYDYSSGAEKGSFGKGGSTKATATRTAGGGGGGGAGYYGGAGGYWKAGAGGSSYINGHSGCTKQNTTYVFDSSSTSMITGANISTKPKPVTTTAGYARITWVSN